MRIPGVILTLGVLWLCGGCCHRGPSFVPVREGIYRSELSTTNRLSLPLTAESREFLLKFLKSGRNPLLDKDATISDPEAPWRYGSP